MEVKYAVSIHISGGISVNRTLYKHLHVYLETRIFFSVLRSPDVMDCVTWVTGRKGQLIVPHISFDLPLCLGVPK